MPTSPLTDCTALARFRARVHRLPDSAMFLQKAAALEIKERLNEVNRQLISVAIVTPFAAVWREIMPDAHIVTDSDLIALEPCAHDLVIHSLSLHWANDPVGQLIQCRRALKPDGLFIGACFGGGTLQELRRALSEAEIALTGGLSPRVAPMGEIRDLGALLQRAGFALPVADSVAKTVMYRNIMHLLHDLRAMGEGNALAARRKMIPPRALFSKAGEIYESAFKGKDGRIGATFEMIFLTGWAPDESQPKPLRPGSATMRLEDALKGRN